MTYTKIKRKKNKKYLKFNVRFEKNYFNFFFFFFAFFNA